MKKTAKFFALTLALCLCCSFVLSASASTFTDAHGNVIELDETLEAYTAHALLGADNAARAGETNLGDLWTDALRWFAVSGTINDYFEDVCAHRILLREQAEATSSAEVLEDLLQTVKNPDHISLFGGARKK